MNKPHLRYYRSCGLVLTIAASETRFLDRIGTRLKLSRKGSAASDDLSVTLALSSEAPSIDRQAHFRCESAWVDREKRIIYNTVSADGESDLDVLVVRPLCSLLISLGYYPIHASAVEVDGALLLLPGEGGSGKSTLAGTLSLLGSRLFCDDMLFAKREGGKFRIVPFPTKFKFRDSLPKRALNLATVTPVRRGKALYKQNLFFAFPRFRAEGSCGLAPVERRNASLRLIKDNLFIQTYCPDNRKAQEDGLDFLCGLGNECAFFEVAYNDFNLLETASLLKQAVAGDTERKRASRKRAERPPHATS